MLHLSESQLIEIRNLAPLEDSKFKYDLSRWGKLHQELSNVVKHFGDQYISRQDVINSFQDYFNRKIGIEFPFVLTMIWGFADTGYGTYRTNAYYNTENIRRMESAFAHVKNKDIQKSYKELKKIKGLNISYISKLLYFSTRALNHSDYYLIFDIRVATALVKLTCPPNLVNLIDVKPSDKFQNYCQYNAEMHLLAKRYDVSAEALEMYLFLY
ncbi:hypothetical protein BEN74_09450 [Acinetobacter sp. WCHAc010034]|uniref:8-oxoguanine DNA glycosylase OGG fold protein n=1 Tax=Acinetobacter sp. WCHAc010034 TaxID=1879049 RepID=UPI00083AC488|nr:hypothetical protein [Acinetobacter sp. WCHAc010034]AYA03047.1 hypothetical protein BEN74_09450 [Acinetobacter sp. WCHAc010034]